MSSCPNPAGPAARPVFRPTDRQACGRSAAGRQDPTTPRPSPAAWLLLLLALAAGWLTAGCAAPPKRLLPPGISVGAFEGRGGPELARELKKRVSAAQGEALELTGRTGFASRTARGRETVLAVEPGETVEALELDPLTGVWWTVERPLPRAVHQDYDLTLTEASLTLEWALTAPDGVARASGRLGDETAGGYGGYLAQLGAAQAQPPTEAELLADLAAALADQLVETLGPAFGAEALARADDELSLQAAALAAEGRWDEAAARWEELTRLNPSYHPALYNLGLHHERASRLELAWAYYRRAFLSRSSPLHREALTRLTDSLARLGRSPRSGSTGQPR
jgi:tetratricopeptide (TPR) repeat protein